jgi:hypothetical protein
MVRVLYNKTYGGFSFSEEFLTKYKEMFETDLDGGGFFECYDRSDEKILEVFDILGVEKSSGKHCKLGVVDIMENLIGYMSIDEYDGKERVYIDYQDAFSQLLDDIMKTGQLTQEHKERYDRMKEYKSTYRIKYIE